MVEAGMKRLRDLAMRATALGAIGVAVACYLLRAVFVGIAGLFGVAGSQAAALVERCERRLPPKPVERPIPPAPPSPAAVIDLDSRRLEAARRGGAAA
jgi:hypothetical protein